jgi:hypothetical protein
MAYSALTLITQAWYTSGIVARRLQTPTGDQITDGLFLLNNLLAVKFAAESRLIPYFSNYEGVFVPGQEEYFIPNLALADTMTFVIQSVRYSMIPLSRRQYFGSPRANNINSLPFNYRMERVEGGTNLFVYFLPQSNWSFEIWGKFGLTSVTLMQDLSLTYDTFYIEYLRYMLAEYMCDFYNQEFLPGNTMRLNQYKKELANLSPPDMSMQKFSDLGTGQSLNYGDINLGHGWRGIN